MTNGGKWLKELLNPLRITPCGRFRAPTPEVAATPGVAKSAMAGITEVKTVPISVAPTILASSVSMMLALLRQRPSSLKS